MIKKNDFLFSLEELRNYLKQKWVLDKTEIPDFNTDFSLLLTKYYADLINWYDLEDPLRKMVVPSLSETIIKDYEMHDPIGDRAHQKIPGLIHRYPNKVLLTLNSSCATHCRFCFRKCLLKQTKVNIREILKYLKSHQEVKEVIFSGGDPFMLSPEFLKDFIGKLEEIEHLKIIRFHTRVPVVYPFGIDNDLIKAIQTKLKSKIVIHINHSREITKEYKKVIKKLQKNNIEILTQSVLLKGVNNDVKVLSQLFHELNKIKIKPYYLHHPDRAPGTSHFRISIEEGKKLMEKLKHDNSDLKLPEYVLDLPGGFGKVSIASLVKVDNNCYQGSGLTGQYVLYKDDRF